MFNKFIDLIDNIENIFILMFTIILDMTGRGNPSKKYPQISVPRDLYDEVRDLKFELKVDTMGDVIRVLIEEHKNKKR